MRQIPKLLLLSGLTLAGCGGGGTVAPPPPPPPPPPPAPVAAVTLTPPGPLNLLVGGTAQLSATPKDAAGNALSRSVTWSSSAGLVASVSSSGLVTAASAGTAQILATSDGVTGQVAITVAPVPVATVVLSATAATLVPNQPFTMTATPKDAAGTALAGRVVAWSSSADGIATVSQAGLVTAVTAGSATITATAETKAAQATITVVEGGFVGTAGGAVAAAAGSVVVTIPAAALPSGTAITVTPDAAPPANASLVPGTAFDFGPDGTVFAQPVSITIKYPAVLPPGLAAAQLRLHKWNGTAWVALAGSTVNTGAGTVTGQTGSFSKYAILAVPVPVATVTLSAGSLNLAVGATSQLSATPRDALGSPLAGRVVTWASSNQGIATVSQTGLVTATAAGGPITISATSEGQTGNLALTVASAVQVFGTPLTVPVSGVYIVSGPSPDYSVCASGFPAPAPGTLAKVEIKHFGAVATVEILVFRYNPVSQVFTVIGSGGNLTLPASGTDIITEKVTNLAIAQGDFIGFTVLSTGGSLRPFSNGSGGMCGTPATAPSAGGTLQMRSTAIPAVLIQGTLTP